MGRVAPGGGIDRAQQRLQRLRSSSRRWLNVGEDVILVAVAVVLLLAGLLIVADAVASLAGALTTRPIAQAVFNVAESALLALILAELVHSLLVSLDGGGLTPEPFLIIAIVAIVRKMLLTTVLIPNPTEAQGLITSIVVEIGALGLVILVLAVALAIIRWSHGQADAREDQK